MSTQPAPLDLDAIQARHAAATGGQWRYEAHAGLGEHGVLGAANIPIGRLDFGNGDQADADRDFVLHAHTDMGALLARVRELEAALNRATRSSYSDRHVWEAWAEEGDRTLCTTEAGARDAACQIWFESEYDGNQPESFVPGWHETAWGLELLDDGEHTSVFVARQDVFGNAPTAPAP